MTCGKTSWYGPGFHGKRTASGQVFNQHEMTTAHPSLPFGSKLKVTNQSNGKSVIVVVNDRGPYAKGRILDVSKAAATELGFRNKGVTNICFEVL